MGLPTMSLEGRVAIVTGAAGSGGMGRAIALAFAEAGADVAVSDLVVDIGDRDLAAVAREIEALGRRSLAIRADVSKRTDVDDMVARTTNELGPVDILVNNAAIIRSSTLLETDDDSWDTVMDVNLRSCFLCSRAVAKGMVDRGRGNIISITSMNALDAVPGRASYNTSKAGIIMLTRSLAWELGSHNIRVNAIAPGAIRTDMGKHNSPGAGAGGAGADPERLKQMQAQLLQRIPLGRMAEPSEVASAALFLASDMASYVTGHTLFVEGGWLA
jgi:3-oxoacyl-[acyl-carrier protein] reductase